MTEGTIVKWSVKEGEKVSAGDVICEIQVRQQEQGEIRVWLHDQGEIQVWRHKKLTLGYGVMKKV